MVKFVVAVLLLGLWLLGVARAELPRRDLLVELRQIDEGGAGYVVGTQPQAALLAPQQVQVRNGAKASLKLGQAMPVQWVQSATTGALGSGVKQKVTWFEAGQSLHVQPRWPGGKQPVALEVEVQSASVQEQPGAPLPTQSRSQVVTTVSAPLGQWVTVASTGAAPQPGVYGSQSAAQTRRLLQLRVLAP
jgi:hypothetical protein